MHNCLTCQRLVLSFLSLNLYPPDNEQINTKTTLTRLSRLIAYLGSGEQHLIRGSATTLFIVIYVMLYPHGCK